MSCGDGAWSVTDSTGDLLRLLETYARVAYSAKKRMRAPGNWDEICLYSSAIGLTGEACVPRGDRFRKSCAAKRWFNRSRRKRGETTLV